MVDEYFQGFAMSAFFQADIKKAIIIGCSEYEELRNMDGLKGFADIPETLDDIMVVRQALRRLKFK